MKPPCGCYHGDDCTKTTVCAIETAVEDAVSEKDAEIERLREGLERIRDWPDEETRDACDGMYRTAEAALK